MSSYNIVSLHNIYLEKIQTKERLQAQLLAIPKDQPLLLQPIQTKLRQYEDVQESMDEYHLNNVRLILLLNGDENVPDDIYNDYVKRYFPTETKQVATEENQKNKKLQCHSCGGFIFVLNTQNDENVCQQCGITEVAHQKVCSYERALELRLGGKKAGYSKSKSLGEYLDYIQLRKRQGIPMVDENKIIELLQGFEKHRIDVKLIHSCMRMLKLSKYYGDKYFLFEKLTGRKITLSPGTERQLYAHFFLEQRAFTQLQREGRIKRWNIFVYRYSVCKIAQLIVFKLSNPEYHDKVDEECTRDLKEVVKLELENLLDIIPQPLVESVETLELYDTYWHMICTINGWKYLSSR